MSKRDMAARNLSSIGSDARCRGRACPARGADLIDDVELIFKRQAAGAGETDPAAEQVFGHLAAVARATGIQRLHVHRFPNRAGLDAGSVQEPDELVAGATKLLLFDEEAA